jgi:hypothetical protein
MPDEIENHLRALRPRPAPPSWRREILSACAETPPRPAWIDFLRWLNPGPAPIAALAGLWLVILGFFVNTPPEPPTIPGHIDIAAVRAAREERQAILAQINTL